MHDTPVFDTEYKFLTPEIIHAIPKVILNYEGPLDVLLQEQVAYAERIVNFAELNQAVAQAEEAPFTLALLVRCSSAHEVAEVASFNHPAVVGVMGDSAEVVEAAQSAWIPFLAEGDAAFEAQSPRVTHAVTLFDDFQISQSGDIVPGPVSTWIRDRGVPIVCDPRAELESGAIESLMDHPLPMLRSLGFRATAANMTTELLLELAEKLELAMEDLYELAMEAMDAAFIAKPLREKIFDEQIYPVFEQWASSVPNAAPATEDSELEDADYGLDASELAGVDPAFLAELGIDPKDLLSANDQHSKDDQSQ